MTSKILLMFGVALLTFHFNQTFPSSRFFPQVSYLYNLVQSYNHGMINATIFNSALHSFTSSSFIYCHESFANFQNCRRASLGCELWVPDAFQPWVSVGTYVEEIQSRMEFRNRFLYIVWHYIGNSSEIQNFGDKPTQFLAYFLWERLNF